MGLGLILWIQSYSKKNKEVKFGANGLGTWFLYLKFMGSPSTGVWQIKMSKASLNVPIVWRPFLIGLACIPRILFFEEADAIEDMYIRVFPYHSLPVLNVSSLTNSRQAFSRRARWLILGAHSDQEKLADSNKEGSCWIQRETVYYWGVATHQFQQRHLISGVS